jgi:hypothetical protein
MKWTQIFEILTGSGQPHVLVDHADEVVSDSDLINDFLGINPRPMGRILSTPNIVRSMSADQRGRRADDLQCHGVVIESIPYNVSATTLLPEIAKLRASMPIMICPVHRFFVRIARLGPAQIGAGLNSLVAGPSRRRIHSYIVPAC